MAAKPVVEIEYCTVCKFRGRAVWLAQELLEEHELDLGGVMLVPGRGGIFTVRARGEVIWSNKEAGRFPEPREVKDALRERLGLSPKKRHD